MIKQCHRLLVWVNYGCYTRQSRLMSAKQEIMPTQRKYHCMDQYLCNRMLFIHSKICTNNNGAMSNIYSLQLFLTVATNHWCLRAWYTSIIIYRLLSSECFLQLLVDFVQLVGLYSIYIYYIIDILSYNWKTNKTNMCCVFEFICVRAVFCK